MTIFCLNRFRSLAKSPILKHGMAEPKLSTQPMLAYVDFKLHEILPQNMKSKTKALQMDNKIFSFSIQNPLQPCHKKIDQRSNLALSVISQFIHQMVHFTVV